MLAIYLKELKSYFRSMSGWLFLALFTLFAGRNFAGYNLYGGYPYIAETLAELLTILLFLIPLITMRSFAEEKKQKTDQLLLTAPIRLSEVILGKFFAMATLMGIATLVPVMGNLLLMAYGDVPAGENAMAILGFFLYGCICIAVGMFLSAVTEHQFIAAILTYGVFLFLIFVPSLCNLLFGADSWIMTVMNLIDIMSPFSMLFSGIVDIRDCTYIVSVIVLCLLFTYLMVGRRSFSWKQAGKKRIITSSVAVILAIVGIVVLNIGVRCIPEEYTQLDMTKERWYSITDETKELLDALDEDVVIYVIGDEYTIDGVIDLYLDAYLKYSDKISVEFKSLEDYPNFSTAYTEDYLSESDLIVTMGEQSRIITAVQCFETAYTGYYDDYGMPISTTTAIDVEGQITAALRSMLNDETAVIYFLEGHGETLISEDILGRFQKGGYVAQNLSLIHEDAVPEDGVTLVVNAPGNDLSETEVNAIRTYIETGGNAILIASVDTADTPNYDALIEEYGVIMTEGSVLEGDAYYVYGQYAFSILPDVVYHAITEQVYQERYPLFMQSRGFTIRDDVSGLLEVSALFTTSDYAYAKVLEANTLMSYEDGDETGPFALGVCTEKYLDNGETATVTIIGSPLFLNEDVDRYVAEANSDIFFAAVNYGSDMELVTTIPAKSVTTDYIVFSEALQTMYSVLITAVLPLILLISGTVIVFLRRRK